MTASKCVAVTLLNKDFMKKDGDEYCQHIKSIDFLLFDFLTLPK